MKKLALLCAVCLAPAAVVRADDLDPNSNGPVRPAAQDKARAESFSSTSPTPEMWFYEQERRRLEDPANIVRANAQQRAAERNARLAAMAWFGYSNARPAASPDQLNGTFSPHWIANGYQSGQWVGGGGSTVILQVDRGASRY
jgi:hypothetical protein